jgi:membrane AbrB-like protein
MALYGQFLLTLTAGGVLAILFSVLKLPSGIRMGAMVGSALLGILFDAAYMPGASKLVVQVIAGALIGCTIEKSDLRRLHAVIKPTLIMVLSYLILNIAAGTLIHVTSPVDLVTAFMCVIPGGVTDTPLIAADMGADTPKVAVLQLARYIMGVSFFPVMILGYERMRTRSAGNDAGTEEKNTGQRESSPTNSAGAFICTLATAYAAGFIGGKTGIPAGAFLFAIIAVLILKLKFDCAYIPPRARIAALVISGCYIGGGITIEDVKGFRALALPLVITLGGYILNCFITGKILSRTCGFSRKEGMLITTPAGASDIALSSADMGIDNTDVIVIQIFRSIIALVLFPQIINLILFMVERSG